VQEVRATAAPDIRAAERLHARAARRSHAQVRPPRRARARGARRPARAPTRARAAAQVRALEARLAEADQRLRELLRASRARLDAAAGEVRASPASAPGRASSRRLTRGAARRPQSCARARAPSAPPGRPPMRPARSARACWCSWSSAWASWPPRRMCGPGAALPCCRAVQLPYGRPWRRAQAAEAALARVGERLDAALEAAAQQRAQAAARAAELERCGPRGRAPRPPPRPAR